jgi:hypothetical protein
MKRRIVFLAEQNDLSGSFASEMNSQTRERNKSNRFSGASTHCLDTKTPPTIGEKPTTAAGCTNALHADVGEDLLYLLRHAYIQSYNKGPSNKEPRALKSPHSINSRSTIHCAATWAYICISNVPH